MNTRLLTLFVLLLVFGAPAVLAQSVDCGNLPTTATAEPAEYAQCRPPMVFEEESFVGAAPAFGLNLSAQTPPGRGFISFDYSNPAAGTLVAATATNYYAGDFVGDNFASLFAVSEDQETDGDAVWIDTATGAVTTVGPTGVPRLDNASGMAYDYTSSTMYLITTGGTSMLWTVDTTTGAATLVAPVTGLPPSGDILINLLSHPVTGVLYTVDIGTIGNDFLYSIDKATGVATVIGDTGVDLNFAQGADFDNATGVAYLCAYSRVGQSMVSFLRTVDLSTGATTAVGSLNNAEVDFCASMNPLVSVGMTDTVGVPGTHALSAAYPNPFNPQASFDLSVTATQAVRVELFNALGQRVAVLFEGTMAGGQTQQLRVDGSQLSSGLYVARVTGQTFADAVTLSLLR
ncbi:MAG TPA: T9SS type A sorting domain-containing protein [Rubricoccaceae bacterium]|jgi:hypothetical protein